MAVVRKNILSDTIVRDNFIRGVKLLKAEDSGRRTNQFGIPGPARVVSTYDLFVVWHHIAMTTATPVSNNPGGRNAAHRGPVFLPWHRVMLMLLEQNLQRVLGDANFGLPYWDWAADGDLSPAQQRTAAIWAANCMGGQGAPVATGPFAHRAGDPAAWRIRIVGTSTGQLAAVDRGMRRMFAGGTPSLPRRAHVANALNLNFYDGPNWDSGSQGFRNRIEGWTADTNESAPWLHNRVHVWVGGDMSPTSSPNDPVFYLNHCNADRVWERWLTRYNRAYAPPQTAPGSLRGHRIDDGIASPFGASMTPRQVLNVGAVYSYDVLP
ncbi:MAG: tyrosinase [Methylocystis sp.]|nr:MAG: tyrosinase [Methylocystis sp.]